MTQDRKNEEMLETCKLQIKQQQQIRRQAERKFTAFHVERSGQPDEKGDERHNYCYQKPQI
jgi:hypothetical protein